MKILFVFAHPSGMAYLRSDLELRQIQDKLRGSKHGGDIQVHLCGAAQPNDLRRSLLEHEPDIVHFSGHGTENEGLLFEDKQENQNPVTSEALKGLFTAFKTTRVVMLNACHSHNEARAIAEVVDCAIGMREPIADGAAIEFAAAFYEALAFGRSVLAAFELGKNALLLNGILADDVPLLFVRAGVDASQMTLLRDPGAAAKRGRAKAKLIPCPNCGWMCKATDNACQMCRASLAAQWPPPPPPLDVLNQSFAAPIAAPSPVAASGHAPPPPPAVGWEPVPPPPPVMMPVAGPPIAPPVVAAPASPSQPIGVFISHASADKSHRARLEVHLSLMMRQDLIRTSHDVDDGSAKRPLGLEDAGMVVLLVSANYLAQDNCYAEMNRAALRSQAGEASVVPILVHDCDWTGLPFAPHASLPPGGKAVSSWRNRNEAWASVARGIRTTVEQIRKRSVVAPRPRPGTLAGSVTISQLQQGEPAQLSPALLSGSMRPCPNCAWMLRNTESVCTMCGTKVATETTGGPAQPSSWNGPAFGSMDPSLYEASPWARAAPAGSYGSAPTGFGSPPMGSGYVGQEAPTFGSSEAGMTPSEYYPTGVVPSPVVAAGQKPDPSPMFFPMDVASTAWVLDEDTPMIGRENDVVDLLEHLDDGPLILWGRGGIGKTTLARHIAQELEPHYGPLIELNLMGSKDGPLTPAAILKHLLETLKPGDPPPDDEADLLRLWQQSAASRRPVLLLDNVDDQAQVAPLLDAPGGLLLLTASQRIDLHRGYARQLHPMSNDDAIALLRAIASDLEVDEPTCAAIAEVCGCIPLALRLAAGVLAHDRNVTASNLLETLRAPHARRDPVAKALIASVQLLNEELLDFWRGICVLLNRVDVFPAAALKVLGTIGADLCRRGLMDVNPMTSRLRMHDLVRTYARAGLGLKGALPAPKSP